MIVQQKLGGTKRVFRPLGAACSPRVRYGIRLRMIAPDPQFGWLEVVCGPMFAGKTSHLLARHAELVATGVAVRVFKPARDTRYSEDSIVTHDGASLSATSVSGADAIRSCEAKAIIIDEAHFFGDALTPVCLELVKAGRWVIVAGVDRDHRGRGFAPFPSLLIEADRVDKLHSKCSVCGGPAVHSQRMVADDSPIVVGGADLYEVRCRRCFKPMGG